MNPRLGLLTPVVVAAAVMICCSSSEDAPSQPPIAEAGPGTDAPGPGSDAGPDASTSSSPDYKSGKRLRAQVLTADGVSMWTAWKDTVLGVDCEFAPAEDMKLRCIPTAETLDGVTFSDIDCKKPVHRGRPGCGTPTIARTFPKTCGGGLGAVRLGGVVDTTVVFEKSATGCNQIPVAGFDVYPVTAAIAPAELVAATTRQFAVSADLATTVLDAEDGASQTLSLYDGTRKAECQRGGGTKDDRCVPTDIAFDEHIYSDMGCANLAAYRPAYQSACTGAPSAILKDGMPGKCGVYTAEYAEVGAKITTRPLFRKGLAPGSCDDANINVSDEGSYWAFGADLPQTKLPALTYLDDGSGRIKLRADATSSSVRLHGRVFFDSERKEPCIPLPTSDGVERCTPVPNANTQPEEFSDDKCEKPLARGETGCSPATFVQIFDSTNASCTISKRRFFKVGAKVTPAQVFVKSGINCVMGALPANVDLYDAATELPPASFVAFTRKTE